MSDNKLVKTIMDAATLTGFSRWHWLGFKKGSKREFNF